MKRTVLALCVFLVACSSKKEVPGPRVDPTLLSLIPGDAVTLSGVRLEEMQKTPVFQKVEKLPVLGFVDEFAKQTQIDPRKNLWELLYIGDGKHSAIAARGKFSDESEPRFPGGGSRFSYRGTNLVGDESNAILLLNPTTFAMGETVLLKKMIDAKDTSRGIPPALAALTKDVPRESQFWGVYTGGPAKIPFELPGNLANLNRIASSIQTTTFTVDLRTGLNAWVAAVCTSQADAQQTEAALKAAIGLGRLSTPSNQPDLQRVFDSMRVTQQDATAKFYLDLAPELIDKATALLPQFPALRGQPK